MSKHRPGTTFRVENFGKSGATAGATIKKFHSYIETSKFAEACEFAPHICIVMLGTNDADNDEPEKAEAGLKALISHLEDTNAGTIIALVLPPGKKVAVCR